MKNTIFVATALCMGLVGNAALAVNYGDNSSEWAYDGECDDPRFAGPGTASVLVEADRYRDAADCSRLMSEGRIWLREGGAPSPAPSPSGSGVNYGDNSSSWAYDGECDDPRFAGPGMASTLLDEDRYRDAADCSRLMSEGQIWLRNGRVPGSGQSCASIDFGNNSSTWAYDGECDDPRFAGPGTASTLLDEDRYRDADDCRRACNAGAVWPR